ncbi:MAG: patatin-like phospholipase family protein [Pseudomonadota bacterium]
MFSTYKLRKAARREMAMAMHYETWLAAAQELDELDGRRTWIEDDSSSCYDMTQVQHVTREMRACRLAREPLRLLDLLQQGVDQHGPYISNPRLYCETYSGETKKLPREFLAEAEAALLYLESEQREGYPDEVKLEMFRQGAHRFGRSALMLSGGATLGIYHLGVVKALFEHDLLPTVLSGSSMGAIVAAGVCTRSDDEVREFFARPGQIHRAAMKLKPLLQILEQRSLFDPPQLLEHIRTNIHGDLTFEEAFARSGRVLNISVSPARSRQKPRILSHVATPDLLIAHSAAASCAMPFLYPPGILMARGADGEATPYLPEERWLDGSVAGDLPMARVGRLHNVNHFIVSQTNPHVYLLVSRSETPSLPYMAFEVAGSMVRAQARSVLGSARRYVHDERVRPALDQIYTLTSQPYLGDINLHPRVDPRMLRKFVSNPSPEDIEHFILEGQRFTWPKLPMIRDQTLISRTIAKVIQRLEARLQGKTVPTPVPAPGIVAHDIH